MEVRHRTDLIEFEFLLSGTLLALDRVVWPEAKGPAKRERRDELWKGTCLELFVSRPDSEGYLEMNLSPSGDWNLYSFDSYRTGMRRAEGEVGMHVPLKTAEPYFRLVGAIRPSSSGGGATEVEGLLASRELVFGATAVIEYVNGEREYWALTHAGAKPDFHLRSSFTSRLQRPTT
ncbi:MAG: hypothetical protein V4760_14745 [Bdellovibrionota bacterium]